MGLLFAVENCLELIRKGEFFGKFSHDLGCVFDSEIQGDHIKLVKICEKFALIIYLKIFFTNI